MDATSWVALAVAITFMSAVGIVSYGRWKAYREHEAFWIEVPCSVPDVKIFSYVKEVTPEVLAKELDLSILLLATYADWTPVAIRSALTGLRVIVRSETEWNADICDSPRGCSPGLVAGQSWVDLRSITVGSGLKALCHEVAHVSEWWVDRTTDYLHAGWTSKGIQTAVNLYRDYERSE